MPRPNPASVIALLQSLPRPSVHERPSDAAEKVADWMEAFTAVFAPFWTEMRGELSGYGADSVTAMPADTTALTEALLDDSVWLARKDIECRRGDEADAFEVLPQLARPLLHRGWAA